MKLLPAEPARPRPTAYACPMHPEVTATWAGTCPKCGMTLRPTGRRPGGEHGTSTTRARRRHATGMSGAGGIEWEDDMVEVNRMTTPANMRWLLVDRDDRCRERRRSTGGSASATR